MRGAGNMPQVLFRWQTLALLLVALGGPIAYLAASPIYSSGDEAAHVDYAYQVWNGALPVFEHGLELQNTTGTRPPVQWTAQHPPLLYLLLAPVVGPLADAGHVEMAGMAARLVVCVLAVALVFAVRWFTRLALPAAPEVATLAALVTGLSVWFIRLGGSVYNDILAALTITLAATSLLATARAPSWKPFTAFVLSLCAASLTRVSLLPLCLILLVGMFAYRSWHQKLPLLRAATPPFFAGCCVLIASGWFYLRNFSLTGSVTGGHPEWAIANISREPRPVLEVAADPAFWSKMLQQFATPTFDSVPWLLLPSLGTIGLFLIPLGAGILMGLRRRRPAVDRLAFGLIIASCCMVAAMQITHVAGAGGTNPRYFFALIPFLAPLLALGLWRTSWRWWALGGWVITRLALFAAELQSTMSRTWHQEQAAIYPALAWAGYTLVAFGALLILLILLPRGRAEDSDGDRGVAVEPAAASGHSAPEGAAIEDLPGYAR